MDLKNPLVSIVTIVYNGESHIEDCIKSVFKQSYKNIQYVIVDGGSSDHTIQIIRKYIDQLDVFISEKDNGISDAFNKGILYCKGDIIGILNSDDLYNPNAVQNIVQVYLDNKSLSGVYYGNIEYFNESKTVKLKAEIGSLWKFMSIYHPATFVTSDVYKNIGGYSEDYKYAMDSEFIHRCLYHKVNFIHVNIVLARFRLGGTSDLNSSKSFREFYKSVKKYNYSLKTEFYLYWGISKKKILRTKVGEFLDGKRNLIAWLLSGKYK